MSASTSQTAKPREVAIQCGQRRLPGSLVIPEGATAAIAFAHGSGSGRHSVRNQFVAEFLQQRGLATLLLDLLEPDEANDRRNVFDIPLLASRLICAADWLNDDPDTRDMTIGYFGASTGGAAALVAESKRPNRVGAIVSRGGRPDMAGDALPGVRAPTLLIVGGNDPEVLKLNQLAYQRMHCHKELVVVPGATHLFPEPGALEEVAQLARNWFVRHLVGGQHQEVEL
jgi:putative phosphoribosyl transferase